MFFLHPPPVSASSLNNLQIRAVLVLWLRWICPCALWECTQAVCRKGDDSCITEDINHMRWTGQPSLLTHRHNLRNVAVVLFELPLNCPVEMKDRNFHLTFVFINTNSLFHVIYTPVPHAIEAVSNDYHQGKTLCIPVLPQKIIV